MRYCGKLGLIGILWLALLPAQAGMVSTAESAAQTATTPPVAIELVRQRVERQLVDRGLEPQQAAARVARLTDEQVVALDGKLATLPAGAGVSTTNLLLIIIIIILLV